ncbi:MAG: hypothetical protein SV862_00055 [Pseudomonadota bacterium]|nr:hypothetical protein [Pseudomonadota bacterium]
MKPPKTITLDEFALREMHRAKVRLGFVRGFATALAEVIRLHGEDTVVADVMKSSAISVEDMEAAGVEAYDLDEIRKAFAAC